MLSAAKVRIHGMQDDNWVIKDKINQYRNLIKLYERDRQIHEGDLVKQKKRYARDIRQLRTDINVKREELGVAVYGDKQFLRNAFQEHRRLQLQYMNSQADRVLESIHQENFNRRKMLDRIRFNKKQKMERFRRMQLEAAELRDRQLYELGGKLPAEKKEQVVANYVQKANIKKNAALAIKVMYKKILDILKKDSTYFTVVLEALKLDCRAQGKCLMGATEMGQLAMEYLDDRKYEFNMLEKEIKLNMKERDRTLKLVRKEVNYLSNSFPKLIRKEEASNLDDLYDDEDDKDSIHSVHWQLEEVTALCKKLQRSTLVSTFEGILPGLQAQKAMSERLMAQLQLNTLKRDNALENMKHARLMLDSLKNIGQEETSLYIRDKKSLQALLEAETREKQRLRKEMNGKGKLIIAMKVSLQQINQLLSGVIGPPPKDHAKGAPTEAPPPPTPQDPMVQAIPELESNIDKLLLTTNQKLTILGNAIAKIEDTPDVRLKAHQLYHGIIARSMQDSYKEEVAAEGGLIEFEMEDASVPSHAIIKLRSKQLVDAQVSEFDVPDVKK